MNKDFPFKTLNQSYLKQSSFQPSSPPSNSQSFYQPRPSNNYSTFSPERLNHSFIGPSVSPPAQHFRLEQLPNKQPETIRSCLQLEHKENNRLPPRQIGASFQQMKVFEERMIQFERRMQRMQKQQRKSETLVKKVEQVMQLKLNDIKIIEDFEQRLALLDQMVRHIKNTKLDRKQLQNTTQLLNNSLFQSEIKELWRQDEVNKNEIKDSKQLIQRLVSKVESSVMTIGQKYQEFIESNIIKSIEHVNKLTSHCHQEIQTFKSDFLKLKDKLETGPLSTNLQLPAQTSLRMMEITIPNIKIMQSITIVNEKKTDSFSLFAKQPKSISSMASYKNSLLNNLYDSIDKSTQSSSAELLLEKVIYKLDREFYLLDENDNYIIDAASNRVRLSNDHIKILEENGLIE